PPPLHSPPADRTPQTVPPPPTLQYRLALAGPTRPGQLGQQLLPKQCDARPVVAAIASTVSALRDRSKLAGCRGPVDERGPVRRFEQAERRGRRLLLVAAQAEEYEYLGAAGCAGVLQQGVGSGG